MTYPYQKIIIEFFKFLEKDYNIIPSDSVMDLFSKDIERDNYKLEDNIKYRVNTQNEVLFAAKVFGRDETIYSGIFYYNGKECRFLSSQGFTPGPWDWDDF